MGVCIGMNFAAEPKGGQMMHGQTDVSNRTELNVRRFKNLLQSDMRLVAAVALASMALSGCAGLVSGANSATATPPDSTLDITNVQTAPPTTSSIQIAWTTNTASDSAVNYGTSASYGSSTPVDSAMVTNHEVTITGLAPSTTYYYQVLSNSKTNHGNSGGHSVKTAGFNISGTISPVTGGSGATLVLNGAASATTAADSSGNYTFAGLPNGAYTVAPSRAGFTFTPASQSATVNGASITGLNFTDTAVTAVPTITAQPANQTVISGQAATFTTAAAGSTPLNYQWQRNGANIAGAVTTSYTTPPTTPSDSGTAFTVMVSNAAGAVTSAAAMLTVNAPAIQVSASSINFTNTVVGVSSSQALIINNPGTATLSITQINETGSVFSIPGLSLPLNVSAGRQASITVGFLPTSAGAFSGNLSIVSNAGTSPTSIGLSGSGVAATLTLGISPASLSFGSVTTATLSAAQNVVVTNTGNSNVLISQVNLSGAGYIMTGGSAVTLAPGQKMTLTVQFGPNAVGTVNGSVSIVSNAPGSPATVLLTGTGIAPVSHIAALTWSPSTSSIAGYNVYRGTVAGGPYTKINLALVGTLNYSDSTVQSGIVYHYVTTSVDSSGNESVFSNEASATIP